MQLHKTLIIELYNKVPVTVAKWNNTNLWIKLIGAVQYLPNWGKKKKSASASHNKSRWNAALDKFSIVKNMLNNEWIIY